MSSSVKEICKELVVGFQLWYLYRRNWRICLCACGVLKFGRIYGFKAYNFFKRKVLWGREKELIYGWKEVRRNVNWISSQSANSLWTVPHGWCTWTLVWTVSVNSDTISKGRKMEKRRKNNKANTPHYSKTINILLINSLFEYNYSLI